MKWVVRLSCPSRKWLGLFLSQRLLCIRLVPIHSRNSVAAPKNSFRHRVNWDLVSFFKAWILWVSQDSVRTKLGSTCKALRVKMWIDHHFINFRMDFFVEWSLKFCYSFGTKAFFQNFFTQDCLESLKSLNVFFALNSLPLHISENVSKSNYPIDLLRKTANKVFSFAIVISCATSNKILTIRCFAVSKRDVACHNSPQRDEVVFFSAWASDRPQVEVFSSSDQLLPLTSDLCFMIWPKTIHLALPKYQSFATILLS